MPDSQLTQTAIELSKTELTAIGGGFLAAGAAIGKALNTLWLRLMARDTENTAQLVQLAKESNAAHAQTAVAIADSGTRTAVAIATMTATLEGKFDQLLQAMPKRESDKTP